MTTRAAKARARKKADRPKITEAAFQRQVIRLARLQGWMVAHFRPGMNRRGEWQTAVAGDGAGFPDLVLVRERVLFVELKSDTGSLEARQHAWGEALVAAGATWLVWRPRDWDQVEETLRREPHEGPAGRGTP